MCLPRDERRLLRYYHKNRDQVGKERNYSLEDLVVVLYCRNFKEESDHIKRESQRKTLENLNENVQRYSEQYNRVRSANEALQQRGLVVLTPKEDSQLITLSLTVQGDDLGRNLNSRIGTYCLWCKGHKVILAIIGLILTLLTAIFAGISAFKNTN